MRIHAFRKSLLSIVLIAGIALPAGTSAGASADSINLFVSPTGNGTDCSAAHPCSLTSAREFVRQKSPTMSKNIFILLKGGTYQLSAPLSFDAGDSGQNGFSVNYVSKPQYPAVFSGGIRIDNWKLVDASKGIYSAAVPKGFDTRQLYVDGVRAERARMLLQNEEGLGGAAIPNGSGWNLNVPGMSQWQNLQDVELVTRMHWMMHRCPVSAVSPPQSKLNMSTGSQFSEAILNPFPNGIGKALVGDFNGDGLSDIFYIGLDLNGASHNYVALSNGNGFSLPSDWLPQQADKAQIYVGDFNGDGKDDLLFSYADSAGLWHLSVALSTGSGFAAPVDWLTGQGEGAKILIGDFNGDGKSDVYFGYGDAHGVWHNGVALSTGSSFESNAEWLANQGQGAQIYSGDFNGDGKSDLLFAWSDASGNWHNSVALSNGSSFSSSTDWLPNIGKGARYTIGDFNGDGKSDLLISSADASGLWHNTVASSTGKAFSSSGDWLPAQGKDMNYFVGHFFKSSTEALLLSKDQSISLQNPCLANAKGSMLNGLNWIENAYELLSQPGQWYLNKSTNTLYYIPSAGEDLTTSIVIAPNLEQLIQAQNAHDINFSGITFAYAGWTEPNSSNGYVELQAGVHFEGAAKPTKNLGNLSFSPGKKISFIHNQFLHLGGTALNLDSGSHHILIEGNSFADISGGAIMFGDFNDGHETQASRQNSMVKIANNYFTRTGVEYESSVPIYIGYANGAIINHNEIDGAPYSGISVGWGWSTSQTYAANNKITQNWIHNVLQTLTDGGGFYSLGSQPDSILSENLIENIGPISTCNKNAKGYLGYVGIYHDAGSEYYSDTKNIVRNSCAYWLLLQSNQPARSSNSWNNTLSGNYVDFDRTWCNSSLGTSDQCGFNGNSISDDVLFGSSLAHDALAIQNAAGLLPHYQFTKRLHSGSLYKKLVRP